MFERRSLPYDSSYMSLMMMHRSRENVLSSYMMQCHIYIWYIYML